MAKTAKRSKVPPYRPIYRVALASPTEPARPRWDFTDAAEAEAK